MSQTDSIVVELPPPTPPDKFEQERSAFWRLLPELLKTYRGKYVAVHQGAVVGEGEDKVEVALAAYQRFGYVEIFVGLVADPPGESVRLTRYRVVPEGSPS